MKQQLRMILAGAAALLLLPYAVAVSADSSTGNKPHETADTLSGCGSVSKMFVTAAVMQLADQEKIDIDKPVTEYLPDFRMADSRYKDITVRMLMNHSSGLMGSYYNGDILLGDRSNNIHDSFLQILSTERLKAAPGAYGSYCNDGFGLLELIAERVSGESFTEYMENHICKPLGLQQTGTHWNAFLTEEQVRVFSQNIEYAPDFCMSVGSGGVLTTAPELCRFGSAFFTGNTVLLSENAKNEMRTVQTDNLYEDGFGLGWDTVSDADYDAAGVQVISKGGDLQFQHGELLVAPDQKISVAVLSSGGGSDSNTKLARALLDIALEEQGISVTHRKPEQMTTLDTVPEALLQYAGIWQGSEDIYQISFPEQRYMQIESLSDPTADTMYFLCTAEQSFAEVKGNPQTGNALQPADEQTVVQFTDQDGEDYLLYGSVSGDENIGYSASPLAYMLQRVRENPVSDAAQNAWNARNGKRCYLISGKWSDSGYCGSAAMRITLPSGVRGYVNNLAIRDENHAETVLHIPSTSSRDQSDWEIREENGAELLIADALGYAFIMEDGIPDLPADLSEVHLTSDAAAWYNINSDAGRFAAVEIPEHAAVYVYDRFDHMIYSSFMKEYGSTIPLPANGKIVFLGETGETVRIRQ